MKKYLQNIDDLIIGDHYYLNIDNKKECYFLLNYVSKKTFEYSDTNSLIFNLKKGLERRGFPDWKYKEQAINKCASYLQCTNIAEVFSSDITIVPIPPSKCKSDPLYDDRLNQILHKAFGKDLDIRDLIIQVESTDSAHSSDVRRDPEKIKENYIIDKSLCDGVKNVIVVFDDVLTTGAHYIAAMHLLHETFPEKEVKGLFIARRIFENGD